MHFIDTWNYWYRINQDVLLFLLFQVDTNVLPILHNFKRFEKYSKVVDFSKYSLIFKKKCVRIGVSLWSYSRMEVSHMYHTSRFR